MLSAHNYWNLGAFTTPEAETILNNTLHMPYAKRWIATDGILVPTGEIRITKNTPLDFTSPKPIGRDIEDAEDFCGTGCTGFDNAVILDRPSPFATGEMRTDIADPGGPEVVLGSEVLRMWAPTTGIEMRLWTNMAGLQVYSCDGLNGTIAVKGSQQHGSFGGSGNRTKTFVPKYGCVVLETQDVSFSLSFSLFLSLSCMSCPSFLFPYLPFCLISWLCLHGFFYSLFFWRYEGELPLCKRIACLCSDENYSGSMASIIPNGVGSNSRFSHQRQRPRSTIRDTRSARTIDGVDVGTGKRNPERFCTWTLCCDDGTGEKPIPSVAASARLSLRLSF
jgi:hypothetical protein